MHLRMSIIGGAVAMAFAPMAQAQIPADTFAFVARLGVDTVAVEYIVRTQSTLDARVVIRSPRTVMLHHRLETGPDGLPRRLETSTLDPVGGDVQRRITYTRAGDSLVIEDVQGDRSTRRAVAAEPEALPFIDLVHWPFEVLLTRMRSSGVARWDAPMVTGQRTAGFPLAFVGSDSATVTHPTRGTMRLRVGDDGGIRSLDAGATTRALVVTRTAGADVAALARDYAARDAAGRGMGALSGRDTTVSTVLGAEILVDFGTPVMRGREIWGALVPYGRVWRTGANLATHFTTSRALRFGDLEVPAGNYTLFSIPEENGGLLLINRQTGQNGQSYDANRDLGRVPLKAHDLADPVEVFSIKVDEENGRGLLRIQWDRRELVAEFTAQAPANTGAFVIRLGTDTVGVEHYVRTGNRIESTIITRSPRTVVRQAVFHLADDGSVRRWGSAPRDQSLEERDNPEPGTIPLVGGSWVPWELVVQRARAAGGDSVTIPVYVFNAVRPTPVRRTGRDTYAFPSQFDQPFSAQVDDRGRIVALDAGGGSTVERVASLDIDRWAREFAARDEADTGLGPLSPRDSVTTTVHGTTITVAYGRPSLRGRPLELLVPPGEVWRTGANVASALITDRTVAFDGLTLEPGAYSIFVVPEAGAWTLIVNRQTGMSGLAREPAQDVGRVPLRTRPDAPHTEQFTIEVRERDDRGELVLRWGGTEAIADFRVATR